MIKAIVLDFGQTLVDSSEGFKLAEKEAQRKVFAALGLADFEEFLELYRDVRGAFHARSRFSRKAILAELFRRYGREADPTLLTAWESEYWERVKATTRVFPEALEVLRKLRERAFRLAMITNAQGQETEGQHRLANYPELEGIFEVVVVAGEGGIPPKPDAAPFLLCLDTLKLAPDETIYVGDDWRIDVEGSRAVGMRPVWLKHRLVRRNWP
ncbi:MAG: HAD family hydrolase, partial [Candidatus Accumulibacter sp.]|nr:HAD family hydrolase [Accumulibacter sp.]